jgi:hypothetical protein
MAQTNRLMPVGEDEPVPDLNLIQPPQPRPVPRPDDPQVIHAYTRMLLTALSAMAQRTVIALASLVDLALAGSVFVLWLLVIAQPTQLQLVGLGMYGAFILICLWLRLGVG